MNNYANWHPVERMMQDVEHLFGDLALLQRKQVKSSLLNEVFHPACEIEEEKDYYLISIDVPGIKREDIHIECVEHCLTVSGQRRASAKKEDKTHRYTERSYGSFKRSFQLPTPVFTDEAEAHYEDGTLRLYLPKSKKDQAKEIKISNGSKTGFFGRLLGHTEHAS